MTTASVMTPVSEAVVPFEEELLNTEIEHHQHDTMYHYQPFTKCIFCMDDNNGARGLPKGRKTSFSVDFTTTSAERVG